MKHIKGKVDLSDWTLNTTEDLENIGYKLAQELPRIGLKMASEALQLIFEDDETELSFPIEWTPRGDGMGGEAPKDPLTVYLIPTIDCDLDRCPVFGFSLRESLKGTMEACKEDGSFSEGLAILAQAFRKLADDIDSVLSKAKEKSL